MDDATWRSILLNYLDRAHRSALEAVDGVGEYDLRRPLTPTGTNLLGLLKHLATVEHGYLVEIPGRTSEADALITWNDEESMRSNAEMWVERSMPSSAVIELYASVAEASRATLEELPLDTPVSVPWWRADQRDTTLGRLAVHVISETAQHAGHLEVLREHLDGRTAMDRSTQGDEQWWDGYVAKIASEAEHFA